MPIDLAPIVVTGVFTLAAGIGGSLGGVALAQRSESQRETVRQLAQSDRDKKNDERAIRDRKAGRLRDSYAALLLTVTERAAVAERWRREPHDFRRATPDEREAALKRLLAQGRIEVDKTQVALQLESEVHGGEVLQIFESFNNALTETFSQVMANIVDDNPEPLGPILNQVREARNKLADTARKHLAELEQPL